MVAQQHYEKIGPKTAQKRFNIGYNWLNLAGTGGATVKVLRTCTSVCDRLSGV